ncbi:MAG: N-acetyltransferase family protein [Rectinemataceae bacterium]|jgi:phosphinothricin acetyltransferase
MIRLAEARDAPQIAEIYRPYVEKTAITFEETPPGADEVAAKIAKVGATFPFLVFEEEGEILGYAYATLFRERAAYRWSLEDSVYVREDSTGRGIGRFLLTALVALLRDMGYVKIYAVITPPNPASVALHERLGFKPLCRFPDTAFKLGKWQAIDWMELTLREATATPEEPIPFPEFARKRRDRVLELLASGEA